MVEYRKYYSVGKYKHYVIYSITKIKQHFTHYLHTYIKYKLTAPSDHSPFVSLQVILRYW